jgi:hypothetical protein
MLWYLWNILKDELLAFYSLWAIKELEREGGDLVTKREKRRQEYLKKKEGTVKLDILSFEEYERRV